MTSKSTTNDTAVPLADSQALPDHGVVAGFFLRVVVWWLWELPLVGHPHERYLRVLLRVASWLSRRRRTTREQPACVGDHSRLAPYCEVSLPLEVEVVPKSEAASPAPSSRSSVNYAGWLAYAHRVRRDRERAYGLTDLVLDSRDAQAQLEEAPSLTTQTN